MGKLANERHELYALHRAKGFGPNKAGIAAGYATGSSTPSELEKDPAVQVRVQEIIDELAERKKAQTEAARAAAQVIGQMTGIGKAWVIEQLAIVAQTAAGDGDYKAANEALKLIGDEFGMFKGASAGEGDEEGAPQPVSLDKLEALMRPAEPADPAALPGDDARDVTPELPDVLPATVEDIEHHISDAALMLIEGQGRHAKKIAEARKVRTGSETDVASTPEAEPDEEDGWTKVDPATPPEALIAMARGEAPIPADPDEPPRRSRRFAHERPLAEPPASPAPAPAPDETPPRRSRR